ncbi:bifunctional acetate--CoA ligase family protein/GNAT family N-acetyltransferase [Cellulomonas gelida]|uniref:GNAT family N-acetyltransferase n=1 Tax=Cellulomonas gelida TaxID=1712 RepID=A0A4Y3KMF1_9CELL|nr:bifunctional GNAT family N-acetyltransferase/acetate--CoA ligase family protein [Cellulomonas gelida]GEA85212.1 GNAT family N-acetyltransferase [Cellulomonas gelida]GGL39467.1 GNAT family N-acetyltransferase [Cellulomonas gelida]
MDDEGREGADASYPAGWEADVVLLDGATTHVRPIRASDADALQAFHVAQSERSTYLRFFAHLERLPERDLQRLVHVDHDERVALVATADDDGPVGYRIIGVARYDRVNEDEAEVAFNIADAQQGRGLGSVLLEHLAAAARERGVRRFVAEVLPQNGRMISVFRDAGYEVRQHAEDGVVSLAFDIDPTDRSFAVMADREHRAEARSMRAVLGARSVLVVGPVLPGAPPPRPLHLGMARKVLAHLALADSHVRVQSVGTDLDPSGEVPAADGGADGAAAEGAEAGDEHATAAAIAGAFAGVDGPVDLAVLAVPAASALAVVRAIAPTGARAVVLLTAGFAETGPHGLELQRAVLAAAHRAGMRLIGPASYGVVSWRPDGALNASLADDLPRPGRIGLFSQSGALAVPLLDALRRRGLGLAEFVSAGHRADVSGNDLMQFWADDEGTDVVGLYLESIGNPRKFSRVARRLALTKPVIVLTAGRSGQVVPPGHAVRATQAPARAVDELMRQSGVIRVENTHQLFDVAQVLALQPLPAGRRVAVVGSSSSGATFVAEAAATAGLVVVGAQVLPEDADDEVSESLIREAIEAPDVDAAIVVRIPTVGGPDPRFGRVVARAAAASGKTVVACVLGLRGVTDELTAPDLDGVPRTVPAYATPEDAALALGHAARYATWRTRDHGRPLHPDGTDLRGAARLVRDWLAGQSQVVLSAEQSGRLLASVGVHVLPSAPVHDADEAVAAARAIGYPVALKTTAPALRHRADLGGVRLDVADETELRADVVEVLALAAGHQGEPGAAPLEVQAMAPRGSSCVVRSVEDPLYGPVISVGLAGDASDLLGDVAYGIPPLTDVDVADLVRAPRAAPRLFGYRGLPPLDVAALEDVVARVAVLSDALPEIRTLELNPVVVAEHGAVALAARITLAHADRADATRRLQRT